MTGRRSPVLAFCFAVCLGACGAPQPEPEMAPPAVLAPGEVQSGLSFLTPETQALQSDTFENPGYLWVEAGHALFRETRGAAAACASCHGADGAALIGAAAYHPTIDPITGTLVNLEGRINLCRSRHQSLPALEYESDDLLSLTSFVANLSAGLPVSVEVTEEMEGALAEGRQYFYRRKGQLNLACSQCHTERWGMQLRGDTISQGHGNGFPTYRLAWQTIGSLHRRFRDCDIGVRAEPYPLGDGVYVALELYLATRGDGLPIETPAIRR